MFKKWCILFLFVSTLFSFGCTSQKSKRSPFYEANGRLKILTTTAMIHDLVSQIGDGHVDSIPLIKGELDPHSYELVKGDDEKFAAAHLIFYNGLGLEHGLSLRQNLEKNPKAISLADPILKEDPSLILIINGQYDPHIWMDISLWRRAVDPIVSHLSGLDPTHADVYRLRGEILKKQMEKEDLACLEMLQKIAPEKRFLVTSHDAFNYFARRYLAVSQEKDWKKRCSAPEGLAPEAQMSLTDILDVISHIEKHKISVIFSESNVSRDSLNKILKAGREKGIPLRLCKIQLYGDSMGNAPSYLAMMRHNVEVIARELAN